MTRSNLYIILTNGERMACVADSSSAPEQGYFVEQVLIPLLSFTDAAKETALIAEHCTLNELRANATYRYEIDLQKKQVRFFEEHYYPKQDVFQKGAERTDRYIAYLESIADETARYTKERFKRYSNERLIARANRLPDFKWDDEGVELQRRRLLSNGAFRYEMRGNTLVILKDEPVQSND